MSGFKLKQLRKKRGVTQTELANRLGVTQQAVGKWETGRSSPDPITLMRLAEYFSVSTDTLLGREGALVGEIHPYMPASEAMVSPARAVTTRTRSGFSEATSAGVSLRNEPLRIAAVGSSAFEPIGTAVRKR